MSSEPEERALFAYSHRDPDLAFLSQRIGLGSAFLLRPFLTIREGEPNTRHLLHNLLRGADRGWRFGVCRDMLQMPGVPRSSLLLSPVQHSLALRIVRHHGYSSLNLRAQE